MANEDDDKKGFKGVGDLFKRPVAGSSTEDANPLQQQPKTSRPKPETSAKSIEQSNTLSASNQSDSSDVDQNKTNEPKGVLVPLLVVVGIIVLIIVGISSMDSSGTRQEYAQESMSGEIAAPTPPPAPRPGYVVTELANVRTAGNPQAEVVAQLPQWSTISVVGSDEKWSQINYFTETGVGNGFMLNQLFTYGTPQDARNAYCDVAGSIRPLSGEVLSQSSTGSHSITVNAGDRDALIKLRRGGVTALSFYVRANETGKVENVEDGQYQVMFATGDDFSRKCLEFMTSMNVIADPNVLDLKTTTENTLDGVATYYATMEYTLTRQSNGNFTPQPVDPGEFKE